MEGGQQEKIIQNGFVERWIMNTVNITEGEEKKMRSPNSGDKKIYDWWGLVPRQSQL